MQVKKIVSLCALAFAGLAAGQAQAALSSAAIAVIDNANANNRVVFISGASAVQKGFNAIIGTLFTGTPFFFRDAASGPDYQAVAGQLAAGLGPYSGQNVILIYRVKGGSVLGVDPVARNQAIESLEVTSTTCGSAGSGSAGDPYFCSLTPTARFRTPDAGVSDVAPFIFKQPYNTEGEPAAAQLTQAEIELLNPTPIYALTFGVPVTTNVPSNVTLARSTVASIFAGNISTWDQVDASQPADDIVICRRVPGSGSQATTNLYFNNFPCGATNPPVDRDSGGAYAAPNYVVPAANSGGLMVVENSTSGQVRNCLNAAMNANATGTNITYATSDRNGNPINVTFMGRPGGHRAIGVLSNDSLGDSTSTSKWTMRALDGPGQITVNTTTGAIETTPPGPGFDPGKYPTKSAHVNGIWDYQGWVSFNIPDRSVADANKGPLLTGFLTRAQDPAILSTLSQGGTASTSGLREAVAAIPAPITSYTPPTPNVIKSAYLNGNQCAPYTKNYK